MKKNFEMKNGLKNEKKKVSPKKLKTFKDWSYREWFRVTTNIDTSSWRLCNCFRRKDQDLDEVKPEVKL